MTKIKLQLRSKTHAHLRAPFEFDSQHVPRVGEMIGLNDLMLDESGRATTYMVVSVISVYIKDEGFIPHITARATGSSNRASILEGVGWLPRTDDFVEEYVDEDLW